MNKKIVIFYNVLLLNNFKNIVNLQLTILMMSGIYQLLLKIFICCAYLNLSTFELNFQFMKDILNSFSKITVINNGKSIPFVQLLNLTLLHLISFSKDNPNYYVCYFQSLGVTRLGKLSWRLFTTYNLFNNYKEKLKLLDTHDVVGSLYNLITGWGKKPHFSGNFWWTTSLYINTLDVLYLRSNIDSRWTNLFFIGTSSKIDVKFYNMLSIPLGKTDTYFHIFNISEVINESN